MSASLSGMDFVSANAVMPSKTIALPDKGLRIEPIMVETKIASNRHDSGLIPSGGVMNAMAKPLPMTTAHFKTRMEAEDDDASAGA